MMQAEVDLVHTLRNGRGMRVAISARDASLLSWWAPDRYGRMADVLAAPMRASLPMDCLCDVVSDTSLLLRLQRDGVAERLRYRLDDEGSLHIDYEATAPNRTRITLPVPAFNLRGHETNVGDHILSLAADRYFPCKAAGTMPLDVAGTAFDFRQPAPIAARLAWPGTRCAAGLDHVFCLASIGELREVVKIVDPASGRVLRFFSCGRQLHVQTDASRFFLAPAALDLLPGHTARQTLVYRLGVADIDALGISEKINQET